MSWNVEWPVIDTQLRLLQDAIEAKDAEIEGLREQLRESEIRWKKILQEERDGSARLLVTLRRSLRNTSAALHRRIRSLELRLRAMGDPAFRDIPDA